MGLRCIDGAKRDALRLNHRILFERSSACCTASPLFIRLVYHKTAPVVKVLAAHVPRDLGKLCHWSCNLFQSVSTKIVCECYFLVVLLLHSACSLAMMCLSKSICWHRWRSQEESFRDKPVAHQGWADRNGGLINLENS